MLVKLIYLGLLVLTLHLSDGAKILGVIPTPAYSHQAAYQSIWRELSLRGHQVTVLTTHPMNDPTLSNITEIDLSSSANAWNDFVPHWVHATNLFSLDFIGRMMDIMEKLVVLQLGNPDVQNLINNKSEHFDLLMVEFHNPSILALSHRFNCPYIGILSYGGTAQTFDAVGNPGHPVLYPDYMFGVQKNLTFFERTISTIWVSFLKVFTDIVLLPKEDLLIKKYYGDNYPSARQLIENLDMLFLNTDPIFGLVRPLTPNIIQIGGGIHRKPSKPLPKDLQTVLDNAKNGFIYFSLGSTVKSENMTEELRNRILETFSELPYTVLWKFELDVLPNKPKNVHIAKWVSQEIILKHPNIKLFITQGGLQSLQESIFNHVPFVGMPFFADQSGNIRNMQTKGLTVFVDRMNLIKEDFKKAIFEVIENPKYRNKMVELANLAQDEPMNGQQKAIWWTEYVLRHKGAKHLRSPALDIPTYQYYLLDVLGFLIIVTTIAVYLLYKIFILTLRFAKMLFKSKRKVE